MTGLDGVAEERAVAEIARVRAQAGQMEVLERRIAEMDALLATPEMDGPKAERALAELLQRGLSENDARVASVRGRLRNIERLWLLRQQAAENLERVCLQIEEIAAQLRLLRFAGGTAAGADAAAAIRQVADAMQTMTEAILPAEGVG